MPGKHQKSKQRCQDLSWMVHDRAQSVHKKAINEQYNCNQCFQNLHEIREQYFR